MSNPKRTDLVRLTNPKRTDLVRLTIWIPADLRLQFQQAARLEARTMKVVLTRLIRAYLGPRAPQENDSAEDS